jgi:hypothetical protein
MAVFGVVEANRLLREYIFQPEAIAEIAGSIKYSIIAVPVIAQHYCSIYVGISPAAPSLNTTTA